MIGAVGQSILTIMRSLETTTQNCHISDPMVSKWGKVSWNSGLERGALITGRFWAGFQVILFVLRSKQQQPTLKRKTPRREGGAFW